jgi:hypothetical protein
VLLKYFSTPVDNSLPQLLPVRLKIVVDKGHDTSIGGVSPGGITNMLSQFKKWISNRFCPSGKASPPSLEELESIASSSASLTSHGATTTADEVFENFILKLESSLGVQREYVVLNSLWEETKEEFGNARQRPGTRKLLGGIGDEFGDVSTRI